MPTTKNVWGQLADLCKKIHTLIYDQHRLGTARKLLPQLEKLVAQIPPDDGSIIGAEGLALYHELKEEYGEALKYRQREIELMELLYEDIRKNAYDDETRQYILQDRDDKVFAVRKEILAALERRLSREPD